MKISILISALFSVLFTSCGKNTLYLSWKGFDYNAAINGNITIGTINIQKTVYGWSVH